MRNKVEISSSDLVLGELLREMRRARSLSHVQVAQLLGVSSQSVSGHESCKHGISEKTLVQYARAYGLADVLALLEEGICVMRKGQDATQRVG